MSLISKLFFFIFFVYLFVNYCFFFLKHDSTNKKLYLDASVNRSGVTDEMAMTKTKVSNRVTATALLTFAFLFFSFYLLVYNSEYVYLFFKMSNSQLFPMVLFGADRIFNGGVSIFFFFFKLYFFCEFFFVCL